MEIRQNFRTVPPRPIALALALLAVLALALTAWYVFGLRTQVGSSELTQAPRVNHLPVSCSNDPYSPHDAICAPYRDPYSPHDPIS